MLCAKEIERLFESQVNTPECDRLEVLTALVEAYEQRHYLIEAPDPIEAILYYLESRGLSWRDLEPAIGSQAKITEILNRQQALTLEMIRRYDQSQARIYLEATSMQIIFLLVESGAVELISSDDWLQW